MKTKIAIFYQGGKTYGGVENYLEKFFLFSDKGEFELTLISLGRWDLAKRIKKSGHSVVEIDFKWYNFFKILELAKLIKEGKFDLTVSAVMVANFYARLSSWWAKVPNVAIIHSDQELDYSGIKIYLFAVSDFLFKHLSTHFICVSEYLKKKLVEKKIPENKISVVYNGISLPAMPKNREGELIIGSIGRLHYTKNYHNLIEAFKLLKSTKVKLIIWGEGEERTGLAELIVKYGLNESVILAGYEGELTKIFPRIDIYIQPSLSEGFGLAVVEAMLAQKPVIVTPAGSLPEIVEDGRTGLIAEGVRPEPLAAALKTLAEDEGLCSSLAQNARKEAIRRFSISRWVSDTEKVYRKVAR